MKFCLESLHQKRFCQLPYSFIKYEPQTKFYMNFYVIFPHTNFPKSDGGLRLKQLRRNLSINSLTHVGISQLLK